MRALRFVPGIALVLVAAAPAVAEPEESPIRPSRDQDAGGRRSLRGCAPDRACNPDDALRDVEAGMFPPAGGPWVDGARPGEPAPAKVTRPSQLRPDAPWLDELVLPDLPVTWTQRLADYLVFYKDDPRGHAIMTGWLEDQGRFKDLILGHLRRAGLPEDLLYVAMIESGYKPETTSYAGAAGLWQFMPEGGRIYGLRIDGWVDERFDPVRATIAVLDYWRDLHQRFGDWHLALAAYNAGYGAVLRSIARYNTNDYWRLSVIENALAWETTLYVPKALAAAICGKNRERMGFTELDSAAVETWDEVAVPGSVPLTAVARAAGTEVAAIRALNPHLRRGRVPPGDARYVVRVPRGAGAGVTDKLAAMRAEWDGLTTHVVAFGERVEDVAMTYGISAGKVRALNELAHDGEAGGGMILVVPEVDAATRDKNREKAIAALHESGQDQKPGEPLIVAVPDKAATVAGKRRVFYRVVAGDKLAELARVLGVSAADLVGWNAIDEDAELQPRMVLEAWVAPRFDAAKANVRLLDDARLLVVTRGSVEHLDATEARLGRVRIEYTAKKKESLEVIGKKFGLGPRDLARINKIKSTSVIEPGQTIIVYKVADKTRSDRAAKQWKQSPEAKKPAKPAKPAAAAKPAPATKPAPAAVAPARGAAPVRTADRVPPGPVTSPSELEADTGAAAADRDGDAGHP